jgi:glycosyltransferase involved in cell wall biosynthesis
LKKYSIITSLFNSINFIDKYFANIFSQISLPDEIILVDDGLNANISEIINQKKLFYNFKEIILITNDKNLGLGLSLNKALKQCKNNLIFRLDADDDWAPNHTNKMINFYKKDSSFLIYAESLKKKSLINDIKCDDFLINENSTIHSSWLINRNIYPKFKYHITNPKIALEDYFTLFWCIYNNYKIFISYNEISTIYNDTIGSLGKRYSNHPSYLKNRKKISVFFFTNQLNKRNFFSKIYFLLFDYGLIKFTILILWTLDYLKIKYFLKKLKNFNSNKNIKF